MGDRRQADQDVTQDETADDSDPQPQSQGEGIGTFQGNLLRRP